MNSISRKLLAAVCALGLAANSIVGALAQDKKNEYKTDANNVLMGGSLTETITITAIDPTGGTPPADGGKGAGAGDASVLQFFAQEMSFDNRLIAGAPFSAAVVSETVQTLADGTRLVQRSDGRLYRDSQGRTRNERSFQLGDLYETKQTITIYDPVGGLSYSLDPQARSANKAQFFRKAENAAANATAPPKANLSSGLTPGHPLKKVQPYYPAAAKAARVSGVVQVATLVSETGEIIEASPLTGHPLLQAAALEAARGWEFKPTELAGKPVKFRAVLNFNFTLVPEASSPDQIASKAPKYTVQTEPLGKQMIEGVECNGERKVTTLLTGAIGNDRPIETVTETWYAPQLRMMILSKRRDPRFGESTYRVTNLTRAEPEASLFQLPPDYTIKESKSKK